MSLMNLHFLVQWKESILSPTQLSSSSTSEVNFEVISVFSATLIVMERDVAAAFLPIPVVLLGGFVKESRQADEFAGRPRQLMKSQQKFSAESKFLKITDYVTFQYTC